MRLLLLASILATARGDGELVTTTTVSTNNSWPENMCNPYHGARYLRIGNACCVTYAGCSSSWDLYEIEVYDLNNVKLSPYSISSTGSGKGRGPELALDSSTSTWWEGDYDVPLNCECWNEDKVGGQHLVLDLGSAVGVSKITIKQGGWSDPWAVKQVQVECSLDMNFDKSAIRYDTSFEETDLECSAGGCSITRCTGSSKTCDLRTFCGGGFAAQSMLATTLVVGAQLLGACW
ncbi:unnamed protein product [Effrenium voratum]|nr:unnamed protein product [Effrenium voratum]